MIIKLIIFIVIDEWTYGNKDKLRIFFSLESLNILHFTLLFYRPSMTRWIGPRFYIYEDINKWTEDVSMLPKDKGCKLRCNHRKCRSKITHIAANHFFCERTENFGHITGFEFIWTGTNCTFITAKISEKEATFFQNGMCFLVWNTRLYRSYL